MSDVSQYLVLLKKDFAKSDKQELLIDENTSTTDISKAKHLKLSDGKLLDLAQETDFIVDNSPFDLRAVYFSWINQNLSAAEYVTDAQKNNIQPLTFLQRNDLISWLNSTSSTSDFIKSKSETFTNFETTSKDQKMDIDDPFLDAILSKERTLLDHNSSLRGFKSVDFSSVSRECEIKIVKGLKRKGADSKDATQNKKRRQNPIILISPAASALVSMSNIKPFFEQSHFVDPNATDPQSQQYLQTEGDIRHVTHVFPKLGKQTFLVVNNTQKFSKPEYWDRVVAIFTTGQSWQFKNYKWSNPNELFRRIKGYYFYYHKDPIIPQVKDWNVEMVSVDKNRRFKDAQVLNSFWDSLEKSMLSKGWSN